MCSNPTRGFRRLLTSSDPQTFSQVRGENTTESVLDVPRGQEISYSPKRHLSSSEIEQIVAGYLAGTTARELGERFEVDRKTVSGILKNNGVTMRLQSMQPDEIEHAIRLYASGLSFAKIAAVLPYDPSTIWRGLKRIGIPRRGANNQRTQSGIGGSSP